MFNMNSNSMQKKCEELWELPDRSTCHVTATQKKPKPNKNATNKKRIEAFEKQLLIQQTEINRQKFKIDSLINIISGNG